MRNKVRFAATAAAGSYASHRLENSSSNEWRDSFRRDPIRLESSPPKPSAEKPLRVLVTGFHDWRDLGTSPNLWRCRDNPSCRLLLGSPSSSPPVQRNGMLPQVLRKKCPEVQFYFQTLTTTWGTSNTLDHLAYDIVINMGLGVYDSHSRIIVENGAYNARGGKDAAGQEVSSTIEMGTGQSLLNDEMAGVVCALHGRSIGGYDVEVPQARISNNYICNETHWRGLKALEVSERQGPSRTLKACFFVHIPTPAKESFANEEERKAYELRFCDLSSDTDYTHLANGVAGVIEALIEECKTRL